MTGLGPSIEGATFAPFFVALRFFRKKQTTTTARRIINNTVMLAPIMAPLELEVVVPLLAAIAAPTTADYNNK
jgi:hypothetical protein